MKFFFSLSIGRGHGLLRQGVLPLLQSVYLLLAWNSVTNWSQMRGLQWWNKLAILGQGIGRLLNIFYILLKAFSIFAFFISNFLSQWGCVSVPQSHPRLQRRRRWNYDSAIGALFSRRPHWRGNLNRDTSTMSQLSTTVSHEHSKAKKASNVAVVPPGLHSKFNSSGLEFLKSSFLRHVHEILEQGIPDGVYMG